MKSTESDPLPVLPTCSAAPSSVGQVPTGAQTIGCHPSSGVTRLHCLLAHPSLTPNPFLFGLWPGQADDEARKESCVVSVRTFSKNLFFFFKATSSCYLSIYESHRTKSHRVLYGSGCSQGWGWHLSVLWINLNTKICSSMSCLQVAPPPPPLPLLKGKWKYSELFCIFFLSGQRSQSLL